MLNFSDNSISVIIPTFNRTKYLLLALSSLRAQTEKNFELIVILDGGPRQEVKDVLSNFQDLKPQLIVLEQNKGVSAAKNAGIRASKCDFVLFLDDDDMLPSEAISTFNQAIAQYDSDTSICGINGILQFFTSTETDHLIFTKKMKPYAKKMHLVTCGGKGIYRKKYIEEVGFFDETLRSSEDTDLNFRLLRKYIKIGLAKLTYLARRHAGPSLHDRPGSTEDYQNVMEKYFEDLKRYPKKQRALFYRTLGVNLLLEGKMDIGRKYLILSVLLDPIHLKAYAVWILSFFGNKAVKNLYNLNTGLR